MNKLKVLRWDIRKFGLRGAGTRLARSIAYHLSPSARRDRDFDKRYGVETEGEIHKSELHLNPDSLGYYATRPHLIESLLAKLPIDRSKFTFIDIGCGKGRPLIVAHEMGFKRLVGLEMDQRLADIAVRNTARLKNVEIFRRDAAELGSWPPVGNLVVYMFNPFGHPTMDKLVYGLGLWANVGQGKIYVVYVNPFCEQPLAESKQFKKIRGITNEYAIYESVG